MGHHFKRGVSNGRLSQPVKKKYQTPYGVVAIERYTYQTSKGGKVWCPLEEQARIIRGGNAPVS